MLNKIHSGKEGIKMHQSTVLSDIQASNEAAAKSLDCLIVELEHYRKQSEWLTLLNDLHARLAAAVDVTSMLEAFSVWLMPKIDHDLIAYNNPGRRRKHMLCSCHGPERRLVNKAAKKIINNFSDYEGRYSFSEGSYNVSILPLHHKKENECLMLLSRGKKIALLEDDLLHEVLGIINESLQRSLNYEDIFEQARRDALTGIANRRVFEERIEQVMESCQRYGHSVTIASMDLDNFKLLNDSLGHAEGDIALQKVAKTMDNMVRTSDLLVRMGGDEFILIMQDTNLAAAGNLAERLRKAVDKLNIQSGDGRKLGISIGLAEWQPGMSQDEWLGQADEILYQAKAAGRSRVCLAEINS